jgi:hypothetical protein
MNAAILDALKTLGTPKIDTVQEAFEDTPNLLIARGTVSKVTMESFETFTSHLPFGLHGAPPTLSFSLYFGPDDFATQSPIVSPKSSSTDEKK